MDMGVCIWVSERGCGCVWVCVFVRMWVWVGGWVCEDVGVRRCAGVKMWMCVGGCVREDEGVCRWVCV